MPDMTPGEYPIVLGTAGHIDHGKTSVVRRLTGVDCDRLSEEKQRGMTIEPGFAPFALPSGRRISIVDVPGHEKFIRQMVAGAAGIDAVMLVVAADDGVMPQTKEHLDILALLGVKHGLTVINKADLVDEETLELAKDDVESLLSGTFLAGKPIVPVSAATGQGIDGLAAEIERLVDSLPKRSPEGAFFMPVDRVFRISGFGTVITGTAAKGAVAEGDDVEILPSGKTAKARSIQVHGESVPKAFAGQRVAVNLASVGTDGIKRGDVAASPDRYSKTDCIDVTISVLASSPVPVEHWQRMRLHIGTSDAVTRVSLLDRDRLLPGESAAAQILPDGPIAVCRDSRFILRTYSPLRTVAGGRVLVASDERPRNREAKASLINMLKILASDSGDRTDITAFIEHRGLVFEGDISRALELTQREITRHATSLEAKKAIFSLKGADVCYLSPAAAERYKGVVTSALTDFHREHPERKGMEADDLAAAISGERRFAKEIIRLCRESGIVKTDDESVSLRGFEPFDESLFLAGTDRLRALLKSSAYAMPSIEEASMALHLSPQETSRIISYLKERKEIAVISGRLLLSADLEADFKAKLEAAAGEITLAGVRDLTGSTRKYMLPLLEYFDSKGITRRVGDKRILLKRGK